VTALIQTTVIGSYPQPDWLIDRDRLRHSLPPRVRARELWRVAEPFLAGAQDDATALAIADQERAGVDIVTDGEIRRESYSNRFATALEGLDIDNPAMVPGRAGGTNAVPRVVGRVRRTRPVEVDDCAFLRARTDRTIKITLPGPFTMSQQASNEFYEHEAELAMDFAAAVNDEARDLFAAGADIVQIDEPWLQSRAEKAREFALPAIDRALRDAAGTTALHTCFGYAAVVHDKPAGYPFLAITESDEWPRAMVRRGVKDPAIWELYRQRSWRYRHTMLANCAEQMRSVLRPIRQFIRRGEAWRERLIASDGRGGFTFIDGEAEDEGRYLPQAVPEDAILERRPLAHTLMRELGLSMSMGTQPPAGGAGHRPTAARISICHPAFPAGRAPIVRREFPIRSNVSRR